MADFFEELGKRISEVTQEIGKKTEDTIEIQKMKSEIRSLKRGNERDYIDLGKSVYDRFQKSEVVDLEFIPLCESVEKKEEEIEKYEAMIRKIKEDM